MPGKTDKELRDLMDFAIAELLEVLQVQEKVEIGGWMTPEEFREWIDEKHTEFLKKKGIH